MEEQAVNRMQWNLVDRKAWMNKLNNFEQRMCFIFKRQEPGWAKIRALELFFSTDKIMLSNRQFSG